MAKDYDAAARILALIENKTKGKKQDFADKCGWSKQYLNKLINGDGIGLNAVSNILKAYPDVNARWLITGEGNMIDSLYIRQMALTLLKLEKYMAVMTEAEKAQLSNGRITWSQEDISRWDHALLNQQENMRKFIEECMQKSEKITNKL